MRVAFEEFDEDISETPPGYQKVEGHLIFDIKMGANFRHETQMVCGRHNAITPTTLIYALVASDSIWMDYRRFKWS